MKEGFWKLSDWEWYGNTNMVRLYLHLILTAQKETTNIQGIDIPRGCLLTCVPMLSAETGLTEKQVRLVLERLEKGRKVGRERVGKMTIITLYEYDSYNPLKNSPGQEKGRIQGREMAGTKEQEEDVSPTPLSVEEKEKEKDKKKILSKDNTKEKKKDFVAPEYAEVFDLWLEYKRQRKESYKSEMSLKICYNKLVKLSSGDPDTAVAIVEQSIANNWAGLFELKQNNYNNGQQQQSYISDPVARRQQERCRRIQALAARLAASQTENSGTDKLPF